MQPNRQSKRKGRQLLVAAVGIASVSYVGTIQGCADTGPEEELGEGQLVADEAPEIGESQQALAAKQTFDARAAVSAQSIAEQILKRGGMPSSGNLMPTPGGTDPGGLPGGLPGGGVIVIDIPPVGNLMATPIDQVAIDPAALEALEALEKQ